MPCGEVMVPGLTGVACAAALTSSVAWAAPAGPAAKAPPSLSRAADVSGFVINGTRAAPIGGAANSVAGAGDVNGDGLADLIIGSPKEDIGLPNDAGRSFVVFGRTGNTAVDLSTVALGIGGFVITEAPAKHVASISDCIVRKCHGPRNSAPTTHSTLAWPCSGTRATRRHRSMR
jgi:hypothetical protein